MSDETARTGQYEREELTLKLQRRGVSLEGSYVRSTDGALMVKDPNGLSHVNAAHLLKNGAVA